MSLGLVVSSLHEESDCMHRGSIRSTWPSVVVTSRRHGRRANWATHTTGTLLALLCLSIPVWAAESTEIASSFDKGDPFDINFSAAYRRSLHRGAIMRELLSSTGSVTLAKEMRYSQINNVLALRSDVGLFRDLQFHIELPIVVGDDRELTFAQNGGASCGVPRTTNCVTPNNSTSVRDGFLNGQAMAADQVLVAGSSGAPGGRLLPTRKGVDQLYWGITWAPFSQARDDTKPTWLLGFEMRAAIGKSMAYDPTNPTANTSVGHGVHQYHFWSAVSRRFRWIDVWTSFHYLLPVAKRSSLHGHTDFSGSGQERSNPQQRGYVDFGMEIVPWERPRESDKFTIELGARIEGVFEGRGYSPLWELLAGQSQLLGPCLAPPGGGPTPWANGTYCDTNSGTIPYPGITRIENHLVLGGRLALNLALSKYFQARLGVGLAHEQDHAITYADAGRAICSAATPQGCLGEIDVNDPRQVNPMYRPLIDAPGRRYRVAESTIFDFFVSAQALF